MNCSIKFCYEISIKNNLCRRHIKHISRYGKPVERNRNSLNEIRTIGDVSYIFLYDKKSQKKGEALIDTIYKEKIFIWEDLQKKRMHKVPDIMQKLYTSNSTEETNNVV